jgi:ribosome-binding factor A
MAGLGPAIHDWLPSLKEGVDARHRADMTNESSKLMARHKQNHRESSQGGSQRQLRVGELIRHAFADMLTRGDVHDPVVETHMITIPEVRVTADLRLATIYVMPMGGRDAEDVVAALERQKKYLRAEIAQRINLKFAPDIRFRVDDRFAEAERIDKLLRSPDVKRDLEHDEDRE